MKVYDGEASIKEKTKKDRRRRADCDRAIIFPPRDRMIKPDEAETRDEEEDNGPDHAG